MRNKTYMLLFAAIYLITATHSFAQDFLGISTGNYAGVTGVMLQPASIVDSRFKFDVNLFSTSINYSNNYLLVSRDAILKYNKDNFGDYATFKQKYLSQASLNANDKVFFNISNRTQIPLSFMLTTGKKSAIALNIQSRSMIQGRDIPQDLASVAYGNFFPASNSGLVNASGFNMLSLNWAEVGLTYGRVLLSNDQHFLKAAFTGKYLGGISSLALGSNDLRLGINADSTFNFSTSSTQYYHNKNADFNNIFDRSFSPDANSFGFDVGFVYEFRGNSDKFKYISREDDKSYEKERRDVNKYMVKFGVSLLDVGKFTFNRPANVNDFSANINRWDIRNQHFSNISQFDTALANRSTPLPNGARSYTVYLPTALSMQLDIRFVKGFYLNVMTYNSVKTGPINSDYHFNNYDYYTVTPRWESRNIGIYIPYTFGNHQQLDAYKDNLLGATVRLGPVFVGSSNLGTMAFNKNLKAADVHIGFKIGFTYGKPNKASMFFDKLSRKSKNNYDTTYPVANNTNVNKNNKDSIYWSSRIKKTSPLIVDYKNGQIYSDGNQSGNIVIVNNNNYYYGNNTAPNKDSSAANNYAAQMNDSIYNNADSAMRSNYKYDSTQKVLNDSLNTKKKRLDSLIRNMQDLRKRMDSTQMQNLNDTIATPKKTSAINSKDSTNTAIKLTGKNNSKTIIKSKSDTSINTNINKNITLKDNNYNNLNDPSQLNNQQQQYLPNQREGIVTYNVTPANANYNKKYKEEQDRNYNQYVDESNQLQREIRDLQREISRSRRSTIVYPRNNYYPNRNATVYPVVVPVNNRNDKVVHVHDTVYVRDAPRGDYARNYNTTDTVYQTISGAPKTVFVPTELSKTNNTNNNNSNKPFESVLFATGRSNIQPMYNKRLNDISSILKERPNLYGLITGHTDATGPQKVNEALSLKRAETVRSYLMNKGVKQNQLIITTMVVGQAGNKKTNAENRRTDIKITDKAF